MPTLTIVLASGLSALVLVPFLAVAGGGTDNPECLPATVTSLGAKSAATGPGPLTAEQVTWDAEQTANAAFIVAFGQTKGVPAWGWVIAVATAMQESRLRNLPGGDADSIGLFQQRPSAGWGTPTQLTDSAYQAGRFYGALLDIPGWQQLPLTEAAQAVQHSDYPDAYAQWTRSATSLVDRLTAYPRESLASAGAWAACPDGQGVLDRAATWLTAWNGGPVPYSMSTNPAALFLGFRRDCSGYASMALGLPGPGLTTAGLAARSTPITKTDLQPGDLLINPTPDGNGHVVIFEAWTDPSMTRYLAYEQSGDGGTHHRTIPYPYYGSYLMTPYRPAISTPSTPRPSPYASALT